MNEILTSLPELAGGETQVLVLGGLFLGILMVTLGAALAIADRDQVGRRLALAQGDHGAVAIEVRRHLAGEGASSSTLTRFVAPSDERERLAVRQRLVQAGFRGAHAVRNYYLIRSGFGSCCPCPCSSAPSPSR
jgi:tight adherence protein C